MNIELNPMEDFPCDGTWAIVYYDRKPGMLQTPAVIVNKPTENYAIGVWAKSGKSWYGSANMNKEGALGWIPLPKAKKPKNKDK